MIRRCNDRDFESIWTIINDGAQAYRGTIPEDRWTEPYMSKEKLQHEIDSGVVFWGCQDDGTLIGVMGLQQVQDVTLIRHAYVRSGSQKQGVGSQLLSHLRELTNAAVLIGT
jgi:GNAT superfamily N-acetyltransferase